MSETTRCVCCGRPVPGTEYACGGCARKAAGHLDDIADLTPDARLVAAGLVRRGGLGGSGKPGSRPPLNDGATDALDEVQNTITTLVRDIAETRGLQRLSEPSEGRMVPDPLVTACQWLGGQLEWLRHAVDGAEPYAILAFAEIAESAGRIRGLVNGPSEQRFLGPCGAEVIRCTCPRDPDDEIDPGDPISTCPVHGWSEAGAVFCDGDIYARHGASNGRCRACGAEVATDLRRAWLDDEVRAHAFRASEIAQAYRINVNTIRSWATRGLLASYWRTSAGLVTPWVDPVLDPVLDPALKGDDLEKRLGEISDEIRDRGGRLHYVGDVLDLAASEAARRAGDQAKRARRAAVKAEDERMSA